jgi:hypothetical protein
VSIRRKNCRQRDSVLHLDVVVGEDIDVEQPIDVRHRVLEILADETADDIGAGSAPAQAVIVVAGNAGDAEGDQRGLQAGRDADRLDHSDPGKVSSC